MIHIWCTLLEYLFKKSQTPSLSWHDNYSHEFCLTYPWDKKKFTLWKNVVIVFEGTWTGFEFKFFKLYFFYFLMSRIVNMNNLKALWKIENQISSYKQVTEVNILCFVNKTQVVLLFTFVFYRYNFQSNVGCFVDKNNLWTHWTVCHKLFWQR